MAFLRKAEKARKAEASSSQTGAGRSKSTLPAMQRRKAKAKAKASEVMTTTLPRNSLATKGHGVFSCVHVVVRGASNCVRRRDGDKPAAPDMKAVAEGLDELRGLLKGQKGDKK